MPRLAVLALIALMLLPAPAPGQSTREMLNRLDALEAEILALRARLGGATGTVAAPPASLESEIQRLTGKVEELENQVRRIADDARRRFDDIEFRLTELEGGDISAIVPSAPLGGGLTVDTGPQVAVSERTALNRAIEDVRQGRYDLGNQRLQDFIRTYQGSPLIGEAQFWYGQSLAQTGNFGAAARSHLNGFNANQVGAFAARNMLELGVNLGRLGQRREACLTLREVRVRFPNAPADVLSQADAEASGVCA